MNVCPLTLGLGATAQSVELSPLDFCLRKHLKFLSVFSSNRK
jgi:hypothetical protein